MREMRESGGRAFLERQKRACRKKREVLLKSHTSLGEDLASGETRGAAFSSVISKLIYTYAPGLVVAEDVSSAQDLRVVLPSIHVPTLV